MKRLPIILGLTGLFGCGLIFGRLHAAGPAQDLVLSCHFAGSERLWTNTDTAKLKEIADLPASRELREQIMSQLAAVPQQWQREQAEINPEQSIIQCRSLLEDLFRAESFWEIRRPENASWECGLAIRLSAERAAIWDGYLRRMITGWHMEPVIPYQANGESGWSTTVAHAPAVFRYVRIQDWCFLGYGPTNLSVLQALRVQVKQQPPTATSDEAPWLSLYLNLPQLLDAGTIDALPFWAPKTAPRIDLTLSSKADYVRTLARLRYRQPQPWTIEPWRIPTHFINEPLISFGAWQSTAAWFSRWDLLRNLMARQPNQCYFWSQSEMPVQTYWAFPVSDGARLMQGLAERLPHYLETNAPGWSLGEYNWIPGHQQILMTGMPMMCPSLSLATNAGMEYLVAGLLPLTLKTNPPPRALLEQIEGRSNLLYYHWEITQEHLNQGRLISQLSQLLVEPETTAPEKPATRKIYYGRKWLEAVAPLLGNAITEITVESPQELELQRKSHCGLTSWELVALAVWLDSDTFPQLNFLTRHQPAH